jgi:hypothetical protein
VTVRAVHLTPSSSSHFYRQFFHCFNHWKKVFLAGGSRLPNQSTLATSNLRAVGFFREEPRPLRRFFHTMVPGGVSALLPSTLPSFYVRVFLDCLSSFSQRTPFPPPLWCVCGAALTDGPGLVDELDCSFTNGQHRLKWNGLCRWLSRRPFALSYLSSVWIC